MTELVLSQLTDVFRIGLIVGLVFTMHKTAAVTGRVLPLVLGVVFLAVMLPATMPNPSASFSGAWAFARPGALCVPPAMLT